MPVLRGMRKGRDSRLARFLPLTHTPLTCASHTPVPAMQAKLDSDMYKGPYAGFNSYCYHPLRQNPGQSQPLWLGAREVCKLVLSRG